MYSYNAFSKHFGKSVDLVPNVTHFEKKTSPCDDFVQNLMRFEFFIKVCNFFESALPHCGPISVPPKFDNSTGTPYYITVHLFLLDDAFNHN